MTYVVEVNGLTKAYGDVLAVNNVSFKLEADKIYGLLGSNGAGKTTIMHMLTAQQFETSGTLRVFGEHPYENSRVLQQVCFIKESQKYPDNYNVRDVLETAEDLYPNWSRELAMSLVEEFQLPLKRNMKKLSRGMLSSVGILIGLASRAPLTIFDEPYLGLDAEKRQLFYDRLLEDYAEHPRTVLLSTHLIDEVGTLLEHVLLINRGQLLLDEETDALRGRAFSVSGAAAAVERFTSGRTVIDRKQLGGLVTASILNTGTSAGQSEAESLGLTVAPVSLQQLTVYYTRLQNRDASANKGAK
jgi:ABC-2 type transport system ATP-binding protein